SVKGLQLGGASRVNEVRINPMLNFEQILWNSSTTILKRVWPRDLAGLNRPGLPLEDRERSTT
ncbi:hypothetical protein, partial [Cupriavidus sp. 8B]